MILAVDVGNSNTVFGAVENGNTIRDARVRTDPEATVTECAIRVEDILSYMKMDAGMFECAMLSTVVPQLKKPFSEALSMVLGTRAITVTPYLDTGVELKVDEPNTVAGDLIVGAAGAKAFYGAPSIVIDLGTASKLIVLDQDGAMIGGSIMPGVNLGLNALAKGTALLPQISLTAPQKAIGTNTVSCMRSGAVYGTASMIDGMIDRYEEELGYSCTLVATGGLAPFIIEQCRHEIICDKDLLIKGLWNIYERNKSKLQK